MRVFINLEAISEARVTNIMQNHIFAWSGNPKEKKDTWHELLKDFERNRTNRYNTESIYLSIPFEERCAFAYVVTRIITDWDRLSFSHLYLLCCQQWNRLCEFIAIDIINDLNNLNSNNKTIEYACKVDLENIEDLYNARDTDGLRKLLYYSEDCDDPEYQCSYKTKVENKIRRCLDRLNTTEFVASVHTSTLIDKDTNIKTDVPDNERNRLIWKVAQEAGYIDENKQWIENGHTMRERAIVAHELGTLFNVNYDKYFSQLWNCRSMTTDYCNALQKDKDRISNLFADALRKAGYFAS